MIYENRFRYWYFSSVKHECPISNSKFARHRDRDLNTPFSRSENAIRRRPDAFAREFPTTVLPERFVPFERRVLRVVNTRIVSVVRRKRDIVLDTRLSRRFVV